VMFVKYCQAGRINMVKIQQGVSQKKIALTIVANEREQTQSGKKNEVMCITCKKMGRYSNEYNE